MDQAYHYLLDFQTYVTQAAGEKYAIRNSHEFLKRQKALQGRKDEGLRTIKPIYARNRTAAVQIQTRLANSEEIWGREQMTDRDVEWHVPCIPGITGYPSLWSIRRIR